MGKLLFFDVLIDLEKLLVVISDVLEWVNFGVDYFMMYCEGDIVCYNGCIVCFIYKGLNYWELGVYGVDEYIWVDIID